MACYALLSLATMVNFHFFPSKLYTNDRNRDLAATAAMADEDGGPLSTHKVPAICFLDQTLRLCECLDDVLPAFRGSAR